MFANHEGSAQLYANTPGHPNQLQAYLETKKILYQWLTIIVKLPRLPGVHIPSPEMYTSRVREEDEISNKMRENFVVATEELQHYTVVIGNLLSVEADVIAHASECVLSETYGLARHIFATTGCNACAERVPDAQTMRCTRATRNEPGTIHVRQRSDRPGYVAHLYCQREHGPVSTQETELQRYAWMKQCLLALAGHMRETGLQSVALPMHISCGNSEGDWIRYEQLVNQWAAMHKAHFDVKLVQNTKHQS